MRHTLYKRLVYWIDANQTWIEVVNDNLYKEQLIKGYGRTGYWVTIVSLVLPIALSGVVGGGGCNVLVWYCP